jgi:signal transduction histidine kinase
MKGCDLMEYSQTKEPIKSYIIQAQEDEIKRIAFELHEGVGQNLYSILTGLQFLETGISEPHMKTYAHEMTQLIEKTIQEIRLLSVELHPPTLTTLGLYPALKSYLKLYTSTFGILVDLKTAGREKILSPENNITVFRVIQEALNNAAKYADTSTINIHFTWQEKELNIVIHDFGKGFELEMTPRTFGLQGMKERMLLTGGDCDISTKIGEGTTVKISLPLT